MISSSHIPRNTARSCGFFVVVALALFGTARAQEQCDDRDALREFFAAKFGEQLVFEGVIGSAEIDLTVSPDGSWSLFQMNAEGSSCLIATGAVSHVQFERKAEQ